MKLHLICAVVMPDHVHLLYFPREDKDGTRYKKAEVIGAMKGSSAHSINRLLGRKGSVWQDESFDHVLRRAEAIEDKILYLCQNPIRAGLCREEREYPWIWRGWEQDQDSNTSPA